MKYIIKDTKPQVGIFEFVDGILLTDTEDVQFINQGGGFFDGMTIHRHDTDIRTKVKYEKDIPEKTKMEFERNSAAYLDYPRGRVDYNVHEGMYYIMASRQFFDNEDMVERVTRAFHLPPMASGKIVIQFDEGHYGY